MARLYVDNATNRKLGRVGLPHGQEKEIRGKKGLLICHGAVYREIPGWEGADTLDIWDQAEPTIVFDLSEDRVAKKYKNKYGEILLVNCNVTAYLYLDGQLGGGVKHLIVPIRQSFQNLWDFLKPHGLVHINNFSLYLDNIKTGKTDEEKLSLFMKTIKDLFRVKDLEFLPRAYLTLEKI